MRCVYRGVQRRRKNWKVPLHKTAGARFFVRLPKKNQWQRRERSGNRPPISMKQYLRQWARRKRMKDRMTAKAEARELHEELESVECVELVALNTTEYTVNPEIQKILEGVKQSEAKSDCHTSIPPTDYVVVPDLLGSLSKIGYSKALYFKKETDNEPCSSQQAADRDECQIRWLEAGRVSDSDKETDRLICQNYVGPKQAPGIATLHSSFLTSREDASTMTTQDFPNFQLNHQTLKELEKQGIYLVLKSIPRSNDWRTRRTEPGCFKSRYIRGRERLEEIRSCQNPGNSGTSSTERTEFLTLTEVLIKNRLPENTVICCSLCRLLISKTLREEFFMNPCDCLDKFVHSECALLNQYEMLRQKCSDCHKLNVDRIVCRSRSPSPTRIEEVALHRLNAEMVKPNSEPLYRRRLPDEFEHDCYICFDKRLIRDDRYEKLDSKVVRACKCRVTGHNQCIVKSLLLNRNCRYCGYRIKFKLKTAEIGCCNSKILIPTVLLIFITLSVTIILLYWTLSSAHFSNRTADRIFKFLITVIIPSTAIFTIAWLCREWRNRSKWPNEGARVVIKEFKLPRAVGGRKIMDNWEECGFGDVEIEIDI